MGGVKQGLYLFGLLNNNYYHILNAPISVYAATAASKSFSMGDPWFGAICTVISAYVGLTSIVFGAAKTSLNRKNKDIAKDENKCPLMQSEEIIIDDKEGLERLLEKTAENKWREWGTVLRVHEDSKRAIVNSIADSESIMEEGLITRIGFSALRMKLTEITKQGYNGVHHFHHKYGAANYAVNIQDRYKPPEWMNLLTFCVRGRPEIIGFNTKDTYIPAERSNSLSSKSRLVKATTKDILQYLK